MIDYQKNILQAHYFILLFYLALFMIGFINNAILLVIILPLGGLFLMGGLFYWIRCVYRDAKETKLI